MSASQVISAFAGLLDELQGFWKNLGKESFERRKNVESNQRKLNKLNSYELKLIELSDILNKKYCEPQVVEQAIVYANKIKEYILDIKKILNDRVVDSDKDIAESIVESNSGKNIEPSDCKNVDLACNLLGSNRDNNQINMSEKFDLRTAASLLPLIDDSENSIKQLIDAIELYDSLLDYDGKKLLTTYVLKTKLSPSAKLRLEKSYNSNKDLVLDIKSNLLTKKSAAALSAELHNTKQRNRSVEQFGKSIEELMVNLTLAQSDGDNDVAAILSAANEKIAINAFANGLRDEDLKTIVKARNCPKLKDALRVALDEETAKKNTNTHQVFHMRGRCGNRGSYGNRGKTNHRRGSFNNNHRNTPNNTNSYQRTNYRGNNRGNNHYSRIFNNRSNQFRGRTNDNRARLSHSRHYVNYCAEDRPMSNHNNANDSSNSTSETNERFFRSSS